MANIKATIDTKANTLTLIVPLQKPTPSASGKTLVVATTSGNAPLDGIEIDGKPVILGLNAYIKR